MTMKMISRTSITSTMGVTLMSELTFLPSSLFTKDIVFAYLWWTLCCVRDSAEEEPPSALSASLRAEGGIGYSRTAYNSYRRPLRFKK
jgi:hypothetical protein